MIRNASRLWGFSDTQDESSFDPLVGLILGALSSELAHISTEINSVESRILEKLVDILTPGPVTGPFPAHTIIKAKASEPKLTINPGYQFYLNKHYMIPGENNTIEKSVFFTPVGKHTLFNGDVKYLITPSKLFEIQEELQKEIIAIGRYGKSGNESEIWLGLQLDSELDDLNGLSFYFDLRNEVYEESFYDSLSKGKWSINGEKVYLKQGIGEIGTELKNRQELLEAELDVTTKVVQHINRFYANRFQTLFVENYKIPKLKDEELPGELYNYFANTDLQKLEKGLVWINVSFPQVLASEVTDDLICSINCFPAFNRHLVEFTQSARQKINIVPLLSEEVFFDVKQITNSDGKQFFPMAFSGINEINQGTYILRNGGVGRFDSRNAAEIISYLIELLRDESAAFSILGVDMISSDIRELNQIVTRLEQRMKSSNVVKKNTPYLLIKPHSEDDDTLFVEFWTTNGEFANKIKNGQKMLIYEGSGLWPDSVKTITSTVGGRERMDTEERVNAYRKALLTHGRVVTKEDIKALCYEHFGKHLNSVEIRKGLETGKGTNSGFFETLDIFIKLQPSTEGHSPEEMEFLRKDLLVKLDEQSSNYLPYRCFINE